MKLDEIQKEALRLTDTESATLAAELLQSLPALLVDADDGVAEASRRSEQLSRDSFSGCSWEEIKQGLGRCPMEVIHLAVRGRLRLHSNPLSAA